MLNFHETVKIDKVKEASAAGTSTIDSDPIDMAGYDGCLFLVNAGAIVAGGVQSLRAQQGEQSNLSDAADLAGTAIPVADDDGDQAFWLDIRRPRERYLRLRILRATQNSEWGPIWAFRYQKKVGPVQNIVADTITGKAVEGPPEGTA